MARPSLTDLITSFFASQRDAWDIAPLLGMESCDPARLDSLLSSYAERIEASPASRDAIIDEAVNDLYNRIRL